MKEDNILSEHNKKAHSKRVESILEQLIFHISAGDKILDVGCGDGMLASELKKTISIEITGLETVKQPKNFIPITLFDGKTIPFPDNSFDKVLLIDVLHHSRDYLRLLKECGRVGKKVIIKDHTYFEPIGLFFLYLSDYISNKPKGVDLPMNFIRRNKWGELIAEAGLLIDHSAWNWKQKKGFDPVRHIFLEVSKPNKEYMR